jgi:hypothetical protein
MHAAMVVASEISFNASDSTKFHAKNAQLRHEDRYQLVTRVYPPAGRVGNDGHANSDHNVIVNISTYLSGTTRPGPKAGVHVGVEGVPEIPLLAYLTSIPEHKSKNNI